ncbi:uncharacterized protein TRIADDRAFT_57268 [Trichoplax adhaerens]|uniref:Cilia- and flagella-associated protein 251 n=1 Tax=Trichoplax adhaerens TaxID=10228 RepID=B3RYZ2_TRIAD|nr:hypothetical protein TRIADDRAFT_57268 [Trichoplax adhaerens]EDV24111.1 hypothetical protein TRIADDRAFT_57268 [Trichoplax adhaerens]|eukprot:XP_002113637.1 hypothetical protein TRIADDRAFT_57268 [Trichoplax adhaerens]
MDTKNQENSTSDNPTATASNALNLMWSFGINRNIPVVNMASDDRKIVLYATAHTGVLYDYETNKQQLLQGHCNSISCICVSNDKRWVAIADQGKDPTIVIWDAQNMLIYLDDTRVPVQTFFDPHKNGVLAMTLSNDSKYLATLSASQPQELCVWDWTSADNNLLHTLQLDEDIPLQTHISFRPDDNRMLISNSERQVVFYSWQFNELLYDVPSLTDKDFNRTVGNYCQSVFIRNVIRAFTATSVGNIVVWDNKGKDKRGLPLKKALKIVRVQEKAITYLTTIGNYIVTGDCLGHVKFYDTEMRLTNCVDLERNEYPRDATIHGSTFVIPNFIVSTSLAQIAHIVSDGSHVEILIKGHDTAINALATHPTEPRLAIGSNSATLEIWNYNTKQILRNRIFDKPTLIQCIAFDPKGAFIACGFTNGIIRIMDAITLEDLPQAIFKYSKDSISHACFSHDCKYLATADDDFAVSVYKSQLKNKDEPWVYLGRQRAHYKSIKGLMFGIALDTNLPRLISIGKDRVLVEYDLNKSSKDDLQMLSTDRIEQSAIPTCITWYPPITKENFLLLANDQFKLKLYNSTTKMCRKTLLGPTYGSPLQKMEILLQENPNGNRYLAFITNDKVGLQILPIDGNPHRTMALMAHPGRVTNMACSYDGQHIFTSGGSDSTVFMWKTNIEALEAAVHLGGEDMVPFYNLMDGGREGELFAELENYFYYAQIRTQGIDTMESRKVSTKVALRQIPYIMRALGFYPTEQEIDDMVNEIKFSEYIETEKFVEEIDLESLIKLYINHRPAFGIPPGRLNEVFKILGIEQNGQYTIDRGDLLKVLQSKGEHITESELAECFGTLLGYSDIGGSLETASYYPTDNSETLLEEQLSENISANTFAEQVLGFPISVDQTETQNEANSN